MFYLYIYIIAWLIMSTHTRHQEEVFVSRKGGRFSPPIEYKNKNFAIIIPKRVNDISEHMTYAMKHHHGDTQEGLHLRIPIGGEDEHIELRPTRSIMSPGMLIETFKHARHSHVQFPDPRKRQCHFSGHIRGRRKSRAAISTCNGLSGYIQTGDGLFMLEPMYRTDHSIDQPHPHILYNGRHKRQEGKEEFCSQQEECDNDILSERTERRVHLVEELYEYHIEILVVLDQSFLQYHQDIDIENYVLTVFNMAHNLFYDSSLAYHISLAIVRLIRLEVEDHEMNLQLNHNINKTMEYFQYWQKKINPVEDTHPNHHDLAVLLTRIDICGDDKTCGFLGASRYAGMCDNINSTIIIQDTGLLAGYILAHEIGHTLGMVHDKVHENIFSDFTDKYKYLENSTVMSPFISEAIHGWSNCSNYSITQFIDNGYGYCLFDTPTEHSFVPTDELPGVMYDGDFQCKTFFGPNAALCMTGIECDNLICFVEDKGCIETQRRPADGTLCGQEKWCFHGACVEIGERPDAVHGNWSEWSEWTKCSRSCGSGVSSQTRQCNNPVPKYGGRFCDGEAVHYKICESEPCPPDAPSFRDIQCTEFNSWIYPGDGKVHTWKSYPMHDENPCALYCVNEVGSVASLLPRVIDGTTCYREVRDICINGICKEIPCDLDLTSSAVEDKCGVCKGNGTSCDVVRGEVSVGCVNFLTDQKNLLTIPAGAVNIKLEEMIPSETRIQVRSQNGKDIYIDGDILGMFNVHGSNAWIGMIRNKQEAISIQGPITESITIWANIEANSTIRYSYGTNATKKRTPAFSWDYLDWSVCSAECGQGIAESLPKCVERSSGLVDETFCKDQPRPKTLHRACEIAPCVPRWFVGDWGKCIKGTHTRVVKCYRPIGNGEGEFDFVPDNVCASGRPKSSEPCHCHQRKRETKPLYSPKKKEDIPKELLDLEDDDEHMYDADTITSTQSPVKVTYSIRTILDFMYAKHLKVIVHTELDSKGKYPSGLSHPKNGGTVYEYKGKDVLKFMNTLQHDFRNNKTKI